MGQRGILRILENDRVGFWCDGCNELHIVRVPPHPRAWGFNGDYDKPTFTPSVLVQGVERLTEDEYERVRSGEVVQQRPRVCHSFVTDGRVAYLSDCTHGLKGMTVELHAPIT